VYLQKNKDCIIKETSLRDALDAKKQNLAEVQATCAAQAAENDAQDVRHGTWSNILGRVRLS